MELWSAFGAFESFGSALLRLDFRLPRHCEERSDVAIRILSAVSPVFGIVKGKRIATPTLRRWLAMTRRGLVSPVITVKPPPRPKGKGQTTP